MSPEMSLNYVCVCEEARLSKKPTQVQGEHGSANGHAADSSLTLKLSTHCSDLRALV